MKHHWRFCPQGNMERVYRDFLITILACRDCNNHEVTKRRYIPEFMLPLVYWWSAWVIRVRSRDLSFRWMPEKEF